MMNSRKDVLEFFWNGFVKTGIYLVGYSGKGLGVGAFGDDLGLYLYSTAIANFLGVDIALGAFYFLQGLVALSGLAVASCAVFARGILPKVIIGFIAVLTWRYLWWMDDVYLANAAVCISIPILLYLLNQKSIVKYLVGFLLVGLLCGFSHTIRIYSWLPILLFLVMVLLFGKISYRSKILSFLLFCFGCAVPNMLLNRVVAGRNRYLYSLDQTYVVQEQKHVFWHSLYIGLGFLQNNKDITWSDTCGCNAAQAQDTSVTYLGPGYEQALKQSFWQVAKQDPDFIMTTVFAKFGVMVWYILWTLLIRLKGLGLLGLWCAYRYRKPWFVDSTFLGASGIAYLPCVFGIPTIKYALGLYVIVVLYVAYSIAWASQKSKHKEFFFL